MCKLFNIVFYVIIFQYCLVGVYRHLKYVFGNLKLNILFLKTEVRRPDRFIQLYINKFFFFWILRLTQTFMVYKIG